MTRQFTTKRQDQLLVTVAYGTGLRWGELTALQPRDVIDRDGPKPKIRVQRAWKRDADGEYYLGAPKTKRSRRTVRISPSVLDALIELGLHKLGKEELLFIGEKANQRLHYSTFGDRWGRAVKRAQTAGTLEKAPTPHDLRHSHAAALISAGHSLTYVQRRLGHESIRTTSDRYGHILPEADDDAMKSIELSLAGARPPIREV
ncbi:site-specific integrase [Streptomyces sp. NPDC001719]